MTLHPKERRGHTRRDLLARAGGAALGALRARGSLLAACSNSTTPGGATGGGTAAPVGPGGLPLARPNKRVTLPRWEDPIASGLKPETGGTFTIFNYPDYLYDEAAQGVLREVQRHAACTPRSTTSPRASSGWRPGSVSPDVMEMTPDNLDQVVAGKLIKPLNLDYIPNLKKNIWPQLVEPVLRRRLALHRSLHRATPPASSGATTTSSRTSPAMTQPWDIFWQSQTYSGKVALLSEDRETIAMALLRRGITDINTEDPKLINRAVSDLKQLYSICNVKVGDSQYQTIPEGTAWLNQAWSGDPLSAYFYYLPKGTPGERHELLEGAQRARARAERLLVDLRDHQEARAGPSVAELHLDNGVAYSNFVNFNGYQPPLNEIDPDTLVKKGVIPENLQTAVLTNDDFGPTSLQEMTLTDTGRVLWQNGYSDFLAG